MEHSTLKNAKKSNPIMQILVILYSFIVIFFTYNLNIQIINVLIGTSPLFLHLLLLHFYDIKYHDNLITVALLSFAFHILFLVAWLSKSFVLLSSMNVPILFVFDLTMSYVFNLIMLYKNLFPKKHNTHIINKYNINHDTDKHNINHHNCKTSPKINYTKLINDYENKSKEYKNKIKYLESKINTQKYDFNLNKNDINMNLRGIEDKCKAINFVIGRVYSDKHGANKFIRNDLKIEKELYNSFSNLMTNFNENNKHILLDLLEKLYRKLLVLELKENEIFKLSESPKIPIVRDLNGQDKIINVLSRNDKDPVYEYYREIKEIISKLIKYLKNN